MIRSHKEFGFLDEASTLFKALMNYTGAAFIPSIDAAFGSPSEVQARWDARRAQREAKALLAVCVEPAAGKTGGRL